MEVVIGSEAKKLTCQEEFPPEVPCAHCDMTAQLAFAVKETGKEDKKVYELRNNKPGVEGEGFWPHDTIAVATYICRWCLEPTSRMNQH